jgi:hypothetical protein
MLTAAIVTLTWGAQGGRHADVIVGPDSGICPGAPAAPVTKPDRSNFSL